MPMHLFWPNRASIPRMFCLIALGSLTLCGARSQEASLRPWSEYRTIMWVSDSAYKQPDQVPMFFQRLREMGINTAMVHGDASLQPVLDNHFPYYVENMVN